MKYVVTGATGFIGARLAHQLARAGHETLAIVRDPGAAAGLAAAGVRLHRGDVTDRASLAAPMRGADGVFHLAGWYAIGRVDAARMQAINVDGARHVLETAAELGVPRIVHTSTVGVFGNTHGRVVGESFRAGLDAMGSEYERSKWRAHHEVAVPLQRRGAPIVITQPGGVTGTGDTSPHVLTFELFLRRMPVMLGARSGLTFAHVDDIAHGHVLAMARGRTGEAYILAGEPLTYRQLFERCTALTGVPATTLWAPGWVATAAARATANLEAMGARPAFSSEALGVLADYTFWGDSARARAELGWMPRPLDDLLCEVLDDLAARGRRGAPPR